jgi:hypothetical protein
MSPLLQRKLRAASTVLVILFSLTLAAGLAWLVHSYESSREPKATPCSRILDDIFAHATGHTPDSSLLEQLLAHRRDCIGDPTYVDQVRRLMLNLQQVDAARSLLEEARRTGTFTPDELKLQLAWVDLAAAQFAWTQDKGPSATNLFAHAVSAAREVREKWPEWSLPYRILAEAGDYDWAKSASEDARHDAQLEARVRGRLVNGAFIRSLTDWQPVFYVFFVAFLGLLALCAGLNSLLAIRELLRLVTSPIGSASSGYVELTGTLHLPPDTSALISPFSKTPSVWYELATRNRARKNSRTHTERSAQSFLLRDGSGEAVIDPHDITVRTEHTDGKSVSPSAVQFGQQILEHVLKADDIVYVQGELSVLVRSGGVTERTVRIAENGRPLLVSTYSKDRLLAMERAWLWLGLAIFALATLVLLWSFFERYHVKIIPGVLS